jgi:hypothetical protein
MAMIDQAGGRHFGFADVEEYGGALADLRSIGFTGIEPSWLLTWADPTLIRHAC